MYIGDLYRIYGDTSTRSFFKCFIKDKVFRMLVLYRVLQKNKLKSRILRVIYILLQDKCCVELPYSTKLGDGARFIHPYAITINNKAVIGKNLTMLKGATIGNSITGKKGSPIIGDNVYIGINSTVVGGIHIGNDVMIAANTFVNFDVPDGALVIGSPGKIYLKEKASEPYISHPI